MQSMDEIRARADELAKESGYEDTMAVASAILGATPYGSMGEVDMTIPPKRNIKLRTYSRHEAKGHDKKKRDKRKMSKASRRQQRGK